MPLSRQSWRSLHHASLNQSAAGSASQRNIARSYRRRYSSTKNDNSSSLLIELFPEYREGFKDVSAEEYDRSISEQEHGSNAVWQQLSPVFRSLLHAGVSRSQSGKLGIISPSKSRREKLTALTLRNASCSLDSTDFFRLVKKNGDTSEGEILQVLPVLDPKTFRKLNSWVLVFRTPYDAKVYQDAFYDHHDITSRHTPSSPESSIMPPPGYMYQGRELYPMLQDYTLLAPSQTPNLPAMLSPFTPHLQSILDLHRIWHGPCGQRMQFPVRLSIDNPSGFQIDRRTVRSILRLHGNMIGVNWEAGLALGNEIKIPPIKSTAKNTGHASGASVCILSFVDSSVAKRFVRWWHKRLLPIEDGSLEASIHRPLMRAEALW